MDGKASGPVTIRQVAEQAGVSRQTVSNVLNFPDRVDPYTAERVREAVEHLGYRPSRAARSLTTRQAGLVGYCLAGFERRSSFMDGFLRALCGAVEESGRHVLLFTAPDGAAGLDVYADLVAQRAVDSFVLADTVDDDPRHEWLARRGIPFVSFGRTWQSHGEQHGSWVDVDGAEACGRLVDGLREAGHQRIAFLGRLPMTGAIRDRQAGWARACGRSGTPGTSDLLVHAETDSVAAGERAAAVLLDSAHPPTAIVAATDLLAAGALREIAGRGLQPGRDVLVTGFDDSELAQVVEPGITSVRQPVADIAATLVSLLGSAHHRGVLLPGEIVSRASAAIPEYLPHGRSLT